MPNVTLFQPNISYAGEARGEGHADTVTDKGRKLYADHPGDTAKFMQVSADHIGGKEGDAYYFLVASSKDVICGCGDQQPKLARAS